MKLLFTTFFFFVSIGFFGQTIPTNRIVAWSRAGLSTEIPDFSTSVYLSDHGGASDGISSNNLALAAAINSLNGNAGVILFDSGIYIFDQTISLSDSVVLRGKGADSTILKFIAPASGDLIRIAGSIQTQEINLQQDAYKGQNYLVLEPNHNLLANDYLQLTLDDVGLITSSWASRTVGQIVEIESVVSDTVFIKSPLRLYFESDSMGEENESKKKCWD